MIEREVLPSFSAQLESEIRYLDDGTPYLLHPSKMMRGGPPPDGIPSIVNPKFVSVRDADEWIDDDEFVVLVEVGGVSRLYPFQIVVSHEIVNNTIDGEPVAVTYCPLCGSVIVFRRMLDGEAVTFGTTGRLYNSNLLMYDRRTYTIWTQIGARAVYGEKTGERLEMLPAQTVFWGDWKKLRPDAEVLSRDTGFYRNYDNPPYQGYGTSNRVWFPVDDYGDDLHSKEVVFGIEIDGEHKAYRAASLEEGTMIHEFAGRELVIEGGAFGSVRIFDRKSGAEVPFERDFWFAWSAFYPETELFE